MANFQKLGIFKNQLIREIELWVQIFIVAIKASSKLKLAYLPIFWLNCRKSRAT